MSDKPINPADHDSDGKSDLPDPASQTDEATIAKQRSGHEPKNVDTARGSETATRNASGPRG